MRGQSVIDTVAAHADKARDIVVVASLGSAPVWLGTLNQMLAAAMGVLGVAYGVFKLLNEIAAWRARRAAKKDGK